MTGEQWRPIVGFEGFYEVSDQGRVRSLGRIVGGNGTRPLAGQVLRAGATSNGGKYRQVSLRREGEHTVARVHTLVAQAFLGPRPAGMDVCHNNGDGTDNRLENLRYDTRSANNRDRAKHGTDHQVVKTHCPQGHAYEGSNLIVYRGSRYCRTCQNAHGAKYRARLRQQVYA